MDSILHSPWTASLQGLLALAGTWLLAFGLKTVRESKVFDTSNPQPLAWRFWAGLSLLTLAAVPTMLLPFAPVAPSAAKLAGDKVRSPWTYAVHLGDSRGRAHELLGNATRTTEVLEEYPLSGVTVWFSPEGRVTKFNFQGSAAALYSSGQNWIPSDRTVVFGLTASSSATDFASRLGSPVDESEVGPLAARELRRIWRKEGYLIDALFLASDRTGGGQTFPKGSLLWVELSSGL